MDIHKFYKISWTFRALLYKLFFGSFKIPSYIGPPVFLLSTKNIYIGKRVRIFPHLRAECHGAGRIIVEDNVSIGQGFHITAMGDIRIGKGTLITGYVSITDIEHEYISTELPIFQQSNIWKRTEIGENCFIGMGARIQAGTTLGKGCIIGANAVVRGVFPDHSVIVGVPGRIIKSYNPVTKNWDRSSR